MGLFCLPMSHEKDARLIWVKWLKWVKHVINFSFQAGLSIESNLVGNTGFLRMMLRLLHNITYKHD